MTDFAKPELPETSSVSDRAVAYLLTRIKNDPRLAYYFLYTESLNMLTAAYAEANGLDVEAFRKDYQGSVSVESPLCTACARETADG